MSGSVHTATLAPPRQAPRRMLSLPALRAGVSMPSAVPMLPHARTLAEAIEPLLFWLGGVRGRRPLTLASYRRDLVCFTAFCRNAGIEAPEAVRHQHIEFYVAWLQQTGGRSLATAARRLSTLRSFFKYLTREEIVTRDPAAVSFG
ncbi:MAG TPA: site-specific integrase, partial [Candidatus Thermoplasmatota archaeon]